VDESVHDFACALPQFLAGSLSLCDELGVHELGEQFHCVGLGLRLGLKVGVPDAREDALADVGGREERGVALEPMSRWLERELRWDVL
jgi:hypothetical protein